MDFNKLTVRSQQAIAAAQEAARRRGNPEVYPEHLLLALLDDDLFADWHHLRAGADQRLAQPPSGQGSPAAPPAAAAFSRVLDRSEDEARKLEDDYVSMEDLFLALEPAPREEILAWVEKVRGGRRVTSQDPEGTYEALSKF